MSFIVTDYMLKLANDLKEKKGVSEGTADAYIRTLVQLNGKQPFKNLAFLKRHDEILDSLKDYALSTRRTMMNSATACLSLVKEGAGYKKVWEQYNQTLKNMADDIASARGDTLQKTDKEAANWVTWEEVIKRREELKKEVEGYTTKQLTAKQWETLQMYVLLCLYTYMPPRRNADYQHMYAVRQWTDKLPTDRNYWDMSKEQMIFNVYKTAKTHGVQVVEVPNTDAVPLKDVLSLYLKYHPLYNAKGAPKGRNAEFRLLVRNDGSVMTSANVITRLLQKAFNGRKVGSSMLRHVYLSAKYGKVVEEMQGDAELMAHTGAIQRTYIRSQAGGAIPELVTAELTDVEEDE